MHRGPEGWGQDRWAGQVGQAGGADRWAGQGAEVWKACTCLQPSRSRAGSSQEPQSGQGLAGAAACPGRWGRPICLPVCPTLDS